MILNRILEESCVEWTSAMHQQRSELHIVPSTLVHESASLKDVQNVLKAELDFASPMVEDEDAFSQDARRVREESPFVHTMAEESVAPSQPAQS
mmetsp:Transcript_51721/g.155234  ORF Transcript_51721/g.155234 Transcript_51721/m.155234 type:complete len:94 (+) Transcript_51721:891-1172(+)